MNARPEVVEEARGWLADCDIPAAGMSNGEVLELVERYYDGGLAEFEHSQNPWGA